MTYCHYSLLLLYSFSPTIKPKPKVSDTSHSSSLANNSETTASHLSLFLSLHCRSGNYGQDIEGGKKGKEPFHPALKANSSISPCSPMSENSEGPQKMVDIECMHLIPSLYLLFPGKASQSCALCLGHIHATTNLCYLPPWNPASMY